jgi:DNA polymerase epsilon subunit 1
VYFATRYPDPEGDKGLNGKKRVNVALPRAQNTNNFMTADGTSTLNVYEVEFDASKKSVVQYGRDVAALLADPNVVGVYERDVPLEDWSIQTIGCVARVKREAANEILDDLKKTHKEGLKKKVKPMLEVSATNLDMRTTTEVNYLPSVMDFTNERALSSAGLLRHCSIYHAALDGKGVFAAHFPKRGGKGKSKGLLILLQPGGRAVREVDNYFVSKQFEDEKRRVDGKEVEEHGDDDGDEMEEDRDSESCEWRVVYARTSTAAAKTLNKAVAEFANASNGPSVVLLEAPPVGYGIPEFDDDDDAFASSSAGMNKNAKAAKRFEKVLTALKDSPILIVPFNSGDVEYLGEKGIAWQRDAAELAAIRLAHTSKHLEKSIQISRYAHIPLCNLDSDWSTHVLDTFFARRLRDEQQVLWSGKNGKPDYGGGSMDDQLSSTLTLESMESPRCELSKSGVYRSVCCELRVHHLVVCAIVNSHILNDLEQGALLGFDGGNATVADRGGHDASNAFRTLRKMVAEMLRDASERGNEIADATLAQLRRWIFSSNSRMREPGLQHLVELCSRKVFTLLISELNRLGADVVFADTRRVIVSTKKNSLASASAFITGLRGALGTRELFNWLELEPTKVWHTLLFRGPHDFGGLAANETVLHTLFLNNNSGEEAPMDTQNVPTDTQLDPAAVEGDEASLEMHWNIATFLPEALSDHFKAIAGEFIVLPWKRERELAADGANSRFGVAKEDKGDAGLDKIKAQLAADDLSDWELDEDDDKKGDQGAAAEKRADADAGKENATPEQAKKESKYHADDASNQNLARNRLKIEEEKATWLCAQIDSHFTPKILSVARGFEKHASRSTHGAARLDERYLFPENLPGAHLPSHLRGNAALAFVKTVIAVLSLDDTIEDAVARCRKNALKLLSIPEFGPEATFYEPCVSFALRDVVCECCGDVRDLDLCRDPDLADGEWRCPECENRYDLQWIEMKLCEEVNARVRKAQTQDLKCKRCTRIKVGHVQNRCPCGGLFETTSKPGALREGLRVFRNVARWHEFDVLASVVHFCESQT